MQDNDSYGNLYAKFVAAMTVLTQGDEAVSRALKTLSTYSTDLENAPISRFLKLRKYGAGRPSIAGTEKSIGDDYAEGITPNITTSELRDAVVSAR